MGVIEQMVPMVPMYVHAVMPQYFELYFAFYPHNLFPHFCSVWHKVTSQHQCISQCTYGKIFQIGFKL